MKAFYMDKVGDEWVLHILNDEVFIKFYTVAEAQLFAKRLNEWCEERIKYYGDIL